MIVSTVGDFGKEGVVKFTYSIDVRKVLQLNFQLILLYKVEQKVRGHLHKDPHTLTPHPHTIAIIQIQ
jgi:hypothetical protein